MKIKEYNDMMNYLTRPGDKKEKLEQLELPLDNPNKILPVDQANAKKYGITPKAANRLREHGDINVETESTKNLEKRLTEARAKGHIGHFEPVLDKLKNKDKKAQVKKQFSLPYSQKAIDDALKVAEEYQLRKSKLQQPEKTLVIEEDPDTEKGLGHIINYKRKVTKI